MSTVYYFVQNTMIDKINSGIIVSEFPNRTLNINGQAYPFITGVLCPKDDIKYESRDYYCIELTVNWKDCYVLNGDLEIVAEQDKYYNSYIQLEHYKFGTYRNPHVAIVKDVEKNNIRLFNKDIGSPIIFENSNNIYNNITFDGFRERYGDFDETILAVFFMLMSHKGKFKLLGKKILQDGKTLYVYEDNESKKIYTTCIQEGKNNG